MIVTAVLISKLGELVSTIFSKISFRLFQFCITGEKLTHQTYPSTALLKIVMQEDAEKRIHSLAEKNLGVLMVGKLDMSQQYALTAQNSNWTLSCTQSSMYSRVRDGILPLYETSPGALQGIWTSWPFKVPFNSEYSIIL